MWYSAPCLMQHAPLRSAFSTPAAYAPDFDSDFIFDVRAGYQLAGGHRRLANMRRGQLWGSRWRGRDAPNWARPQGERPSAVQQSRRVVSVDPLDQSEARQWTARYGLADRVEFRARRGHRLLPPAGSAI